VYIEYNKIWALKKFNICPTHTKNAHTDNKSTSDITVNTINTMLLLGIATGYRLDSQGSNPSGGEIFCTCPDLPWGPPSLLYNGYRVFPGGKEQPRRDTDPSPPSSAVGHERVELYLYSPYGAYGLYRASVPVQGCTSPHNALTYFLSFY